MENAMCSVLRALISTMLIDMQTAVWKSEAMFPTGTHQDMFRVT